MKTKKEIMYDRITAHGETLNKIFETGTDPVKLCKKLRRIELEANRRATQYCNGDITTDDWEGIAPLLLAKVEKALKFTSKGVPVFINSDPRGYALKISSEWVTGYNSKAEKRIYSDWGGYGIIAPDFREV